MKRTSKTSALAAAEVLGLAPAATARTSALDRPGHIPADKGPEAIG